jgi:hypothetical protein
MKKFANLFIQLSVLVSAHVASAQNIVGVESDPTLTAVNLSPENPLAILLNDALPIEAADTTFTPFGTWTTKTVLISASSEDTGYTIACSSLLKFSRAPIEPIFKGCQVNTHPESEEGIVTLTTKDLLLKMGGIAVLPSPVGTPESLPPFPCRTRAC